MVEWCHYECRHKAGYLYRYTFLHACSHTYSIFNTGKPQVSIHECICFFIYRKESTNVHIFKWCMHVWLRCNIFCDYILDFTDYIAVNTFLINTEWALLEGILGGTAWETRLHTATQAVLSHRALTVAVVDVRLRPKQTYSPVSLTGLPLRTLMHGFLDR